MQNPALVLPFALLLVACAGQPTADHADAPLPADAVIDSKAVNSAAPTFATRLLSDTKPATNDDLTDMSPEQAESIERMLEIYMTQAQASNDIELIRQAAQFSLLTGHPDKTREMTELWLAQQPNNNDAWHAQALADLLLNNTDGLDDDIRQLFRIAPDKGLDRLLADASQLPNGPFYQLVTAISHLVSDFPNEPRFWFAKALHYQHQGDLNAALEACDNALSINTYHLPCARLQAQLLAKLGKSSKALKLLTQQHRHYADNPDIAVDRIQLLLASKRRAAKRAIRRFNQRFPDQHELRFLVALSSLKAQHNKQAVQILHALADSNYRPNDVNFLLAQIYQQQKDDDAAITHYLRVSGDSEISAKVAAAQLYYQRQQPQQASALFQQLRQQFPQRAALIYATEAAELKQQHNQRAYQQLLSSAIEAFPKDANLLYMRALEANKLQDYNAMEADLRTIVEHHPRDIDALNSLAYTLINHSDQQQEAWYYAKRAHSLAADNAAIQDTLGWILFHLGQYQRALELLEASYQANADPEVASHLITVLRTMGQQQQAQRVLLKAHKRFPNNTFLTSIPSQP